MGGLEHAHNGARGQAWGVVARCAWHEAGDVRVGGGGVHALDHGGAHNREQRFAECAAARTLARQQRDRIGPLTRQCVSARSWAASVWRLGCTCTGWQPADMNRGAIAGAVASGIQGRQCTRSGAPTPRATGERQPTRLRCGWRSIASKFEQISNPECTRKRTRALSVRSNNPGLKPLCAYGVMVLSTTWMPGSQS